jgi:tetratricopeptide (TPR) repeat protein
MKKLALVSLIFSSGIQAQTLKDAIYKTDNERFSEASSEFKLLVSIEPTGCNYFYYGENYLEWGETDSAMMVWTIGFEKDALAPMSSVAKGKMLWLQGNKDAAKAEFSKALTATKNKNAEVIRAIAETYIESENKSLDEAIALLETATKLDPKNEDGHLLMGDALLEKTPTNGSPAIVSYKKVLEINPKSPRGIVRIAKLYQRAQNYEEANNYYQEAKVVDATYAPAYRENAELYMMFKQNAKAIENWKKYLELNNSDEARYRFATAMYSGKQYCEVIPEIEGLQAKGFNNFYMERMLTYSYYECGKDADFIKKGLSASDRFFQLAPPADKIIYKDYKYRGLFLSKSGSDSLAIIELEKASAIDQDAAKELSTDIAKLYAKLKKFDKVIEIYEAKKSYATLSATEQFDLGNAYFKGPKDFVKADTAFATVLSVSPTYYPAAYYRARCAYSFDPNKEKWLAKPFLERVVDLIKPEERTSKNNKPIVMEAAKYLGDYYVNSAEKNAEKANMYWGIVKELDPTDKQADAFFKRNGQ